MILVKLNNQGFAGDAIKYSISAFRSLIIPNERNKFYERYYLSRRFRHKALSINQGDVEAAASYL